MTEHVVVIGGGMVAHRVVEALRSRDTAGTYRVTVVAEEDRAPYDRVGLSAFFSGSTPDELLLGDPAMWEDERVDLRLRTGATAVDRESRTVTTAGGDVVGYDHLVLATGSYAWVPPVPGADAAGVFVYRTIDDVVALRDWVTGRATALGRPVRGVVVGGGLLGLEAAGALVGLDAHPTVVEFAPRLMALQVDEGGGHALRRIIEAMGVGVRVGAGSESVTVDAHGRVAGLRVAGDEADLPADVVVFATGVRPRDELAAPPVWPPVPAAASSSTRAAARRTRASTRSARSPASRAAASVSSRPATRWPRSPSTGSSAATPPSRGPTCRPSSSSSASTSPRSATPSPRRRAPSSSCTPTRCPGSTRSSSSPTTRAPSSAASSSATPRPTRACDRWSVPRSAATRACGCSRTTPGPSGPRSSCRTAPPSVRATTSPRARCGVRCSEKGCHDVGSVKACTRAGTSCGSCIPLVKKLVGAEMARAGLAVSTAMCEHVAMSRAELYTAVQVTGLRTFSDIIDRFGAGRGCDICKPVIASVLASLYDEHVLADDRAALQDTNDRVMANLQKDGTYSVVPRVPGGEILPEQLILIGGIAKDYGLYTKITGGQRIDLFGARLEQLPAIWQRLVDGGMESGHAYGKSLRTVKSCVGSSWCRFGVQDSVAMAVLLELRYRGLRSPHKLKLGVSGCARECAEARGKDVGLIATDRGWNVYVGGNGGFTPRHAELLVEDVDDDTAIRLVDRYLMYYVRTADRLQRTAPWQQDHEGGLERIRAIVVDDVLGICADLDEQMARHVDSYEDEWAAVLRDPVRLRQFASFVNAPDTADPTLSYVTERGQRRPATEVERASGLASPGPVLIAPTTLEVRS